MVETAVANPTVGARCMFIDPVGVAHDALITSVHGPTSKEERDAQYQQAKADGQPYATDEWLEQAIGAPFLIPSVNLVFVVGDESKTDSYGRQIERATSCPHESTQTAHGYKYVLPHE